MIRLKPSDGWSPTWIWTRTGSGSASAGVTGTVTVCVTRAGAEGIAQPYVTCQSPAAWLPVAEGCGAAVVGGDVVAGAVAAVFALGAGAVDRAEVASSRPVEQAAAASSTTRLASSGTR